MFLLDTCVVSELRKVERGADPGVVSWIRDTPTSLLHISVMTAHELEHGVLLAEHRDPSKGAILRTWLDSQVIPAFVDRTIGIDIGVARRAAELHVPSPAPYRDAMIGATALERGFTMVTRNVCDFTRFGGLEVVNPWV